MTARSKVISQIGLWGSLASILGFLAQFDFVPALGFVATTIPLPAWIIILVIGLSMWLIPGAVARAIHATSRDLSAKLEGALAESGRRGQDNEKLRENLAAAANRCRELSESYERIRDELRASAERVSELEQKLGDYESLEAEIKGLLRSGGEFSLLELAQGTCAGGANGQQRVLRAIEKLGQHVEGTGGVLRKYRMKPQA